MTSPLGLLVSEDHADLSVIAVCRRRGGTGPHTQHRPLELSKGYHYKHSKSSKDVTELTLLEVSPSPGSSARLLFFLALSIVTTKTRLWRFEILSHVSGVDVRSRKLSRMCDNNVVAVVVKCKQTDVIFSPQPPPSWIY